MVFDLSSAREQIDMIDDELAKLMAQRFAITDEIGRYKKVRGLSVRNPERERAVINRAVAVTGEDLRNEVTEIFSLLMQLARGREEEI